MYYLYLLLIFFILYIICKVYIRIKYKFWAYQPVFHYYDLWYWISQKGIINKELPETNKFCNFLNISTKDFSELDENTLKDIIGLIRTHYYRNKYADYLPTLSSFSSYFIGNNDKTFISLYYDSTIIVDKDLSTIPDKQLLGTITSRPVNITLKELDTFKAYYVDYLCVHTDYRKKGIAPEIIQSHVHMQRHKNKKVAVSLFKREGELTGIVALTIYKTYQFHIKNIPREVLPHASMQLIEITKLNIRLLIDFICNQKAKFECFILPDYGNLLNMVSDTYHIYGIIENNSLIACYFFRNSYMSYDMRSEKERDEGIKQNKVKSIELFASINNCHHNEIFIKGFSIALHKYAKKKALITIENIGHNNIIINNLFILKLVPRIVSPTAYFYYNYVKKPIFPEKAFIIC